MPLILVAIANTKKSKMNEVNSPKVLAILTKTWGSTPQQAGAKMQIWKDGFAGTLGGGQLEFEVISKARKILASEDKTLVEDFVLSQDLKQCCGGKVQVYFEKQTAHRKVLCFGAGHVAQELSKVLVGTQIELHVVDSRSEWVSQLMLPTVGHLEEPLTFLEKHGGEFSGIAVVMTHSHDLDEKIIDRLVSSPEFVNIGLIGSDVKWRRFRARLQNTNLAEEMLEKVHCPVGLFKGSKEPREIAISIAGQILKWVWN